MTFYDAAPALARFADFAESDAFAEVPADWYVAVTDVRGSTAAVQAGRYREVNYVGAAGIAAALNLAGEVDLPFVFGGDGATVLLPPALLDPMRRALAALRQRAAADLALELRAAVVPLTDLLRDGHALAVARYPVSEGYTQAVFRGDGLAEAERRAKAPTLNARYAVPDGLGAPDGDDPFGGLECRWRDVPSPHGETLSLIVGEAERGTLQATLEAIEAIYGEGDAAHPIDASKLQLGLGAAQHGPERRLRRKGGITLWLQALLGVALIRLGATTQETDWARYPHLLRAATDYRKYDGTLRMVLAGTAAQRRALEAHLEQQYAAGQLRYGLHVSDHATLTCLVFNRMGRQVHFVDGSGGGYTRAAQQFKLRRPASATPVAA